MILESNNHWSDDRWIFKATLGVHKWRAAHGHGWKAMRKHWREELRIHVKSKQRKLLTMRSSSHPANSRSCVSCPALSGTLLRHLVLAEPCTSRSSCFPSTWLPISVVISLALQISLGSPVIPGQWAPDLAAQLVTVGVLGPVNSSMLTSHTNFFLLHPSLACLVFTKWSCHYLFGIINFTAVAKHSDDFNFFIFSTPPN